MIIGDAHDQSALALHQVLHRRHHFLCLSMSVSSGPDAFRPVHRFGAFPYQDADCRDKPGYGDTRIRNAQKYHASSRLKTSVALVPPKPKEFDSTVPILALSMRLRTIGMSAKTGSSSLIWALSQMKPLFIINSE